MQIEDIKQLAASCGLVIKLRTANLDLWASTLMSCSYVPVAYTNASIEFQWTYQLGHGGDWHDLSFIIFLDNKPIAVWPLSLAKKDNKTILNSHGLPMLPPLFLADCPISACKRIIKNCLDFANKLATANDLSSWECMQLFNNTHGLSYWHAESMSRGATSIIYHEMFVDLSLSMQEIKGHFRKSYKSLITEGTRLWDIGVLNTADESIWNEFRNLHYQVAGRTTRSEQTWRLHLKDIEMQQAFLVYLRNRDGSMVGGGFFNFTRDEGLYAVAAYDRSLFDKPLGHVVQYRAIEELKNRGVRWYKIGVRSYRSENPPPSDKEVSISEFKQGFASHLFPRIALHYPIKQKELLA
ncbi:MAG: FemAB family protein [Legionella sp.]|nr:MAG: FemAB family protein [Legionella sp.]